MKKLSLLALLLTFCLSAICAPVSVQMAQRVAEAYWSKMNGNKAAFVVSQTEFSEFYVFNNQNGGGFVLVSADDIAHPILGYSNKGSFRTDVQLPVNVRTWFKGISKEISTSVAVGVQQSAEIAAEWDAILNGSVSPKRATRAVNPLISTTWDQGKPYNNMCPADANDYDCGGRTVTGCVATAMAQVMKYWNYPAQGNGSHSYSHSTYGTLSANFGNTTYDWTNMPNNLTNNSSSAQKTAVATLMYHCGVAVEMDYDIAENGGSGAYSISYGYSYNQMPTAQTALVQCFKYKSSIRGLLRDNYSNETTWKNLLKADIDAGRPIIYSGASDEGGHCFVCDGYNDDDLFHFNWGWSGRYDAYYSLNAMTPGSGGIGGAGYDFSEDQDAILNIEPQGMTVNPTFLNFVSTGESKTFTVTASTASNTSWNATLSSGASSWLTVTPTTGNGNGATTTVTVTASANDTESQRTATITITQGTETATVNISQSRASSGNEDCTVLHEDRFTSNITIYSTSEDGGYVCGSNQYGDQAKAEHFENSGEHNITSVDYAYAIDGTNGSVTFKIWADNNGTPGNELASQQVTLSTLYSAATNNSDVMIGEYTWTLSSPVTVTGNFFAGLDVSSANSYIGLVSTVQGNGYTDGYEYYNGTWSDMYTNWDGLDISMYILPTVCQPSSSSNNLSVNPTSLSYVAAGESKTITVTSNTSWTASSSASWLTLNPTSGSNNGTITATAAANTGSSQRTATITVSGNGVSAQTISVTQAANSTTYSLSVNPTSLSYTANGESKTVTVTSNTSWTASSSASWLTISPASGSNNGSFTAVAAANSSTTQRTATITVSGNGVSAQTISVTQAGASSGDDDDNCIVLHEDRFTSNITIYSTSEDGGYVCGSNQYGDQAKAEHFENSGEHNITSVDYVYAIDGTNGSVTFKIWADNNGTPGNELASQQVTLSTLYSAATNNSDVMIGEYTWTLSSPVTVTGNFFAGLDVSSANSYIGLVSTVQGNGYTDGYEYYNGTWSDMYTNWDGLDISMYILPTVCPTSAPSYNLSVNPTSLSYTANGESKTVTVTSNTSWTVSSSASWLTISPASGSNNGSFTAVAAANSSTSQRTATITVSGNGVSAQTISVTQAANSTTYSLSVNPTSLSYTANGESKTVTVTSNTSWTVSSSASWLTISPASGSNNGSFTAVAAANSSTSQRTATITVSGNGVSAQTISVTQAGAPTSIEEETVAGISVYPNPTNGSFAINFSAIEGNVTYQLINAKGAMIESKEINASDNSQMSFDYNIAAGVYFVRIISGEKTWTERIIVE